MTDDLVSSPIKGTFCGLFKSHTPEAMTSQPKLPEMHCFIHLKTLPMLNGTPFRAYII